MSGVSFDGVTKIYPDQTRAISSLSLDIPDGALLVLVGPSGCGKSTLLRMVAGLEAITEGEIRIGDRVINDVPPRERDIAMVFQSYALYPHMSVHDNMSFSLRLRRLPRSEIDPKVDEVATLLGLTDLLAKRPAQLSGGQRQRVAMGRAMVRAPSVFLLDEPLSNLDAQLRAQVRAEIARIHRTLGTTTLYVTHDQLEAMTLGDLVAVLRGGVIQQVTDPRNLYQHPANTFVARFIGSPPMNLSRATVSRAANQVRVDLYGLTLILSADRFESSAHLDLLIGREVVVGVRPEDIAIAPPGQPDPYEPTLTATVDLQEIVGSESYIYFTVSPIGVSRPSGSDESGNNSASPGELGGLDSSRRAQWVARVGAETGIREGGQVQLVFNSRAFHFFDAETGESTCDTRG